jgi:FkbM family methyltransferase
MNSLQKAIEFAKDSRLIFGYQLPWEQRRGIWAELTKLKLQSRARHRAHIGGFEVSYFSLDLLIVLYQEIFARQSYRFQTANPAPLILDCGSNIGLATLFFKSLFRNASIRCFEPDPTTFQVLQENVIRNQLTGVRLHNVALCDRDMEIDFFTHPAQPGNGVMSLDPKRAGGTPISVPGRKLSTYIDADVDFLKLDVEGAELSVLQDLAESGKLLRIEQMVIEYHHKIPGNRSALGAFLGILEEAHFEYQIVAPGQLCPNRERFQDAMIFAYRT